MVQLRRRMIKAFREKFYRKIFSYFTNHVIWIDQEIFQL